MNKNEIINILKNTKNDFDISQFVLFGSVSTNTNHKNSDIDIAYRLDYNKFSQKYVDGFSKLLRIEEIKDELKKIFKKNIDFVPDKNKKFLQGIIYV